MGLYRTLLMAICFFALQPNVGQAQTAKEQAKALFLEGRDHFVAERYADALKAFREANALTPHPVMLLNIAKVYESMNDLAAAIDSYNAYLQSKDDNEIRTKVAMLNAQLATWPAVEVTTSPSGAEVRVGDQRFSARGSTPLMLKLPPGNHTIYLRRAGFQDIQRKVSLLKGARSKVSVALQPALSAVSIVTNPPGARVEVNGQALPRLTPVTASFPQGTVQLSVTATGFAPVVKQLVLGPQHTAAAPLSVNLELQKAETGLLVVAVSQTGAQVKVDGEVRGVSPLSGPLTLTAGLHQLEVLHQGQKVHSEMVSIKAGETTQTAVDHTQSAPLNLRTASIVGIGVGGLVFVGGVVVGAMALSTDSDLSDCRQDAQCAHTNEELNLSDDVKSQSLSADILMGSGLAIAGACAAYYFLNPDSTLTTEGVISVLPQKGGTLISGSWVF